MIARALLLALLLSWPFAAAAAADVAVPQLSGRVVDQTDTLSASDAAALTQRLKDLETRKGSQVAVLIVPTTQPETIEQFSIRVAEAWKIGRKKIDDGALLVVAKDDHKLRIEVGYGLEGALTDVTSRRIIDEIIVPRFKTGDFTGGISAGVDRIIRVIDGEPLPVPKPEVSHSVDPNMFFDIIFSPFGFLGYAAIAAIMRGLLGR
ncbi:MAG: YgcG family protein, partial [Bradyrhizobium sp.]|uniref:TPM domain-containing protein n=1 Tax=Bradyrhizobium sp. TaxID=376 RepID=UPI003C48BE87